MSFKALVAIQPFGLLKSANFLGLMLFAINGQVVLAEGIFSTVSAGLTLDDNVSRAEKSSDRKGDTIYKLGLAVRKNTILTETSGLSLSGKLEASVFERYHDLNNLNLGGTVSYILRPESGYTAPWYALSASAMLLEFIDSDIRDGWMGVLELGSGRRLTDQLSGQLGLGYEARQAFDGEVFDIENYRLSGSLSYTPLSTLRLFAGYSLADGETVSTATPNAEIKSKSNAREPDDVFGGGGPAGRVAYQLDAVTQQFELGGNYRMDGDVSIDVSVRYMDIHAVGNNNYYDWSVFGGLNWHF